MAVVLQAHLDALRETGVLDSFARKFCLLLGDRDGRDAAAVPLCGVAREAAPSAADFEDVIGGFEAQFAAERVVFRGLRGFE